jgi:hypothetical protein
MLKEAKERDFEPRFVLFWYASLKKPNLDEPEPKELMSEIPMTKSQFPNNFPWWLSPPTNDENCIF